MQGVEILNTYQYAISNNSGIIVILACTFLLIVSFASAIIMADKTNLSTTVATIISLVLGLTVFDAILRFSNPVIKYETRHQVTISDDANFKDVTDKYEIISQDGRIYTIRDKEKK